MPRTKQKRAKRSSTGHEQMLRDFNRLMQLRIHKLDLELKSVENKFDASIQVALTRYPLEIQNMTLQELLKVEETPKKENLPPKTPRIAKESTKKSMKPQKSMNPKRVTAASDDGYQSESTASQASKMTAGTTRRSRSSSRERTKQKSMLLGSTQKNTKKDMLKTPDHKTTNSFVITPKVKLNSAINVLRKPKDGEMVFSTQGSPLLVSTTVNDKTANINVPLRNGTVVSLLPFNETSLTEDIRLDDETRHQLRILQSHLNKVLK